MHNYQTIVVIENLGIKTEEFYLSPFVLKEGEIIMIKIHNDPISYEIERTLKRLLSGIENSTKIKIFKKINIVHEIIEPFFNYHFSPLTVEKYIKKNALKKSPIPQKNIRN